MLLSPSDRSKLDPSEDTAFYSFPRFVHHVDDKFIQQLTSLYRQRLHCRMRVLDLMSSWVSHLPEEIRYDGVEGHGMNEEELKRNPRLNDFRVRDLNQQPELPWEDRSFHAVLMAVSVQYLQYPEAIFAEIQRVLKVQGVAIVSFSNRMFYQKAIQAWRDGSDRERVELVKKYFNTTPGFTEPEIFANVPSFNPLLAMLGLVEDPFYAAIAYRK